MSYKLDERAKSILEHYGEETQALKAIEELAELQRAIARQDLDNMHEEIADVHIMLEQLAGFAGIDMKKVKCIVDGKLDRELKRINAVG